MDWFLYDKERDKNDLNEKVIYSSHGSRNELKLLEQTLLRIDLILLSGDLPIQIFSDVRQRLSRIPVL